MRGVEWKFTVTMLQRFVQTKCFESCFAKSKLVSVLLSSLKRLFIWDLFASMSWNWDNEFGLAIRSEWNHLGLVLPPPKYFIDFSLWDYPTRWRRWESTQSSRCLPPAIPGRHIWLCYNSFFLSVTLCRLLSSKSLICATCSAIQGKSAHRGIKGAQARHSFVSCLCLSEKNIQ